MTPLKIFTSACIFWIIFEVIIGSLLLKSRRGKWVLGVKFKKRRYFFVLSFVPFAYLVTAYFYGYRYFLFFILSGVAGMVGETVFSAIWDMFFDKKLYEYHESVVAAKYSSLLNFFPWAMGAMIFLMIADFFQVDFSVLFFLSTALTFAAVTVVFAVFSLIRYGRSRLNLPFSTPRYILFILPILVGYAVLIIVKSFNYFYIFFLFIAIASFSEYLFGKAAKLIFGHRLWTYNYLKIDKGNTSFTVPVIWAFGGMYFLTLAALLGLF